MRTWLIRGVPALLVAIGGVAGATSRIAVAAIVPDAGGFPWPALLVNVLGCAAIGVCARVIRDARLWLLLATGGLGGFTTFSAFADDARRLVADGRPWIALAYVGASVVGGLGATRLGRDGRRPPAGVAP